MLPFWMGGSKRRQDVSVRSCGLLVEVFLAPPFDLAAMVVFGKQESSFVALEREKKQE
jgi:hypothetical protein